MIERKKLKMALCQKIEGILQMSHLHGKMHRQKIRRNTKMLTRGEIDLEEFEDEIENYEKDLNKLKRLHKNARLLEE